MRRPNLSVRNKVVNAQWSVISIPVVPEKKGPPIGAGRATFPFQAREAWTFPSIPSVPRNPVEHRRRGPGHAFRPRRSETLYPDYRCDGLRKASEDSTAFPLL